MQTTYKHPWNTALELLENTTTSESELTRKPRLVTTGPKSIEWAAGIFEGEGCLTYNTSGKAWVMKMKMTDFDVMEDFYTTIGEIGRFYRNRKSPHMKDNHKPYHDWQLNKKDYIFELAVLFYPYMYERRREKFREFFAWYFQ